MKTPLLNTIAISVASLMIVSCEVNTPHNELYPVDNDLKVAWENLTRSIEQENCVDLLKTSTQTIRCYDCLGNTDVENEELNRLKETDDNWYEKIYEEKINIPANHFCAEDISILFGDEFKKNLKEMPAIYSTNTDENQYDAEILITVNDNENQQTSYTLGFEFKRINEAYKFSGINTTP